MIMFKISLLILLFFVAGCVTIPVPPTGENPGKYGKIQISIMFIPNVNELFTLNDKNVKPVK